MFQTFYSKHFFAAYYFHTVISPHKNLIISNTILIKLQGALKNDTDAGNSSFRYE